MRQWLLTLILLTQPLVAESLSLEDLFGEAEQNNVQLQALRHQLGAASAYVCEGRSAFQPKLSWESGAVLEDLEERKDNYGYSYLQGRWNVYRGGQDCAEQRVRHLQRNIVCLEWHRQRKLLLHDVWKEFSQLLYFSQALDLYDQALTSNIEHQEMAQRKYDAGLSTEADVMEFDLFANQLKAEQRCLIREMHQHRHRLALLVGRPEEGCGFDVEGTFVQYSDKELCDTFYQALEQREDKTQANEKQCVQDALWEKSWGRHLPKVDLRASFGTEPEVEEDRSFGSRFEVQVSVPLFNGRSPYYERRMISERRHYLRSMESYLEQEIYAQISTLLCRLDVLRERLQLGLEQEKVAAGYWTLTREEYQRGVKNSPDLAGANQRRLQTKLDVIALQRDIALGMIELSQASGNDPLDHS